MIRLAEHGDLEVILRIYEIARQYMRDNGNPLQWADNYPETEIVLQDIRHERLYVYEENGIVHGVFMFMTEDEPVYSRIENGAWKNDRRYGTIHRVASDGTIKGMFGRCLDFCKSRIDNLKIDTHESNTTMRHVLEKHGFHECGTIYLEDGSPRIAYQFAIS